jgi:hypothetical protein
MVPQASGALGGLWACPVKHDIGAMTFEGGLRVDVRSSLGLGERCRSVPHAGEEREGARQGFINNLGIVAGIPG